MKMNCFIPVLTFLFIMGCVSSGTFPHSTTTSVDLSKKNYRIVKMNAFGESMGFKFLGIIPLISPKYRNAMVDLYSNSGISEGKAHALTNVIQERSSVYLILFSLPKLTVRADVIEFLDEGEKSK